MTQEAFLAELEAIEAEHFRKGRIWRQPLRVRLWHLYRAWTGNNRVPCPPCNSRARGMYQGLCLETRQPEKGRCRMNRMNRMVFPNSLP